MLIVLSLFLVAATGVVGPSNGAGGVGAADDGKSPCTSTPAACQGASTPLPGQAVADGVGSTAARPGCATNRVVTTDGRVQSDSMPYCPQGPGAGDGPATVDSDGDGTPDAPAPPPPPTHAEIVSEVCPAPSPARVGHNPREYGITGMDTWLWSAGDNSPRSAAGTIRGYAVTCALTAVEFTFDTNDTNAARYGHPRTYSSSVPGSESETTEVKHFWETKGTYRLELIVTWQRVTSVGADTVTRTAVADYPVKEIVIGMTVPDD